MKTEDNLNTSASQHRDEDARTLPSPDGWLLRCRLGKQWGAWTECSADFAAAHPSGPDHEVRRFYFTPPEPANSVTRTEAETFLVAYHGEVWNAAAAEDGRVAYDEAGLDLAKAFLAKLGPAI
jgi:hypothetical protein